MSKLGAIAALDEALKTHVAILATTGMGKSYLVRGVVERALNSGSERALIIDPKGVHYGIRLKRDGKTPSKYKVAIFGGLHGDLPLLPHQGSKIARIVGETSTSVILDMRGMSVGNRTKFFADFAEELAGCNRGLVRMVIDEAHIFAPQAGGMRDPARSRMIHATNELVSGGRSAGLRIVLISQRPAKLHKDALTQTHALVALGLFHPLDRGAVEDWIAEQADKKVGAELLGSLASLPVGAGWVWAPRFDVLEKVEFPTIATFDSFKPLAANETPAALPPIDVEALSLALAPPARPAAASATPIPTRLVAKTTHSPTPKEQRAREAARAREIDEAVQRGYQDGYRMGDEHGFARGFDAALRAVRNQIGAIRQGPYEPPPVPKRPPPKRGAPMAAPTPALAVERPERAPSYRSTTQATADADSSKMGAERRALGPLVSAYPGGLSEAQWALAAGYKRTGGTWGAYKSRLRSGGMIEQRDGLWYAAEAAVLAMGDQVPLLPPAGPELVEFWAGKMSGKAADMLRLLASAPDSIYSKAELAAAVGMEASGGSFGTYLSRLRGVGLVVNEDGGIRVSPALLG